MNSMYNKLLVCSLKSLYKCIGNTWTIVYQNTNGNYLCIVMNRIRWGCNSTIFILCIY